MYNYQRLCHWNIRLFCHRCIRSLLVQLISHG